MKTGNRNRGYDSKLPICVPAGDSAILVYLGSKLDPAINARVHALARELLQNPLDGFLETVPGYSSLMVAYNPLRLDFHKVSEWITKKYKNTSKTPPPQPSHIQIPVVYGGEHGPDLGFVAAHNHLTEKEVIAIHSKQEYLVCFIGFLPGFPYLAGMDPAIAAPRLETPRTQVPAGSVGIAGDQTGIYPFDSPGGWRIIGWTPLRLFDPSREQPALFKPGDYVQMVPLFPDGVQT